MRLLLVEDEVEIQGFLQRSLAEAGYQVEAAGDARTAERMAVESTHDVLVVDLGLPDEDGLSLILRLRQLGLRAPVLILSARRSVDDRVRGLEQGGDDYLTKPFALAELLARLRNLVKRNSSSVAEATRLRVLDLELDLLRREASRSGEILNLTPQEFVLLEYLCRNSGRVVTRSMILDELWGMRIQPRIQLPRHLRDQKTNNQPAQKRREPRKLLLGRRDRQSHLPSRKLHHPSRPQRRHLLRRNPQTQRHRRPRHETTRLHHRRTPRPTHQRGNGG